MQILPPPEGAPDTNIEIADHSFVLEFPIREATLWSITNDRRLRKHRNLTLLLNALLAGRTSCLLRRQDHFWGCFTLSTGASEFKWVQNFYFAKLGKVITGRLSSPTGEPVREVTAERYYTEVGHDGQGLRVPSDLDELICLYLKLSAVNRAKVDRATFWIDIASRTWNMSLSASFAARVAAIESLTTRGTSHSVYCPDCGKSTTHEVPGPTALFKDFFETYAPGVAQRKRRDMMYSLRSTIVHGGDLVQLDMDRAIGWDPPGWDELELSRELSALTRTALRNWLKANA